MFYFLCLIAFGRFDNRHFQSNIGWCLISQESAVGTDVAMIFTKELEKTWITRIIGWCYCPRKLLAEQGFWALTDYATRQQSIKITKLLCAGDEIVRDAEGDFLRKYVAQAPLIVVECCFDEVCLFLFEKKLFDCFRGIKAKSHYLYSGETTIFDLPNAFDDIKYVPLSMVLAKFEECFGYSLATSFSEKEIKTTLEHESGATRIYRGPTDVSMKYFCFVYACLCQHNMSSLLFKRVAASPSDSWVAVEIFPPWMPVSAVVVPGHREEQHEYRWKGLLVSPVIQEIVDDAGPNADFGRVYIQIYVESVCLRSLIQRR